MDDLAARIKASIENPNTELWFPDLTSDLTVRAWQSLYRDFELTPDSYGTERVVSRNISAPRKIITSLKSCPPACSTSSTIAIEALAPALVTKYQQQGVSFYSADEILNTTILLCLEDALAIINQVPSLMTTVATLVQSLHILKPEDLDYDVSFSEPHVPFSIFVSVPEKRIATDSLRVAEAIVHEAMHLQLTLIDRVIPLTSSTERKYYSPWRGEYRNALGVLQALYVFQVVANIMGRLRLNQGWTADNEVFISQRCILIRGQVKETEFFWNSTALTPSGTALSYRLFHI